MHQFSEVPVHCNNCGDLFVTVFMEYDGRFCCYGCSKEFNLRKRVARIHEKHDPKIKEENDASLR